MNIIFASNNASKLIEIKAAFEPRGFNIITPEDIGLKDFDVEETGNTYAENAFIKANAIYTKTGIPAIGDDSGIEVDYLHGEPGLYSHRWYGNEDPCQKMIKALEGVPYEKRTAHYITTLCYVDGKEMYVDGVINGHLIDNARGNNGFAFDAIFIPDGMDKTFGEMEIEEKNKISARGEAAKEMVKILAAERELR